MMLEQILRFFANTSPGGIGVWTIVAMLAGFLAKEWRETRKLSAEDRLARREGYAKQVESLEDENRELRNDLRDLRGEYDRYRHICQLETDQLRQMLIAVQGELAGLKRRTDTLSLVIASQGEIRP